MRVNVRFFLGGVLQSQDLLDLTPEDFDKVIPDMAERHASRMLDRPGMVEFEFLDEPDVNLRFVRIGTDKRGMVHPVDLNDVVLRKFR